MRIRLKPTLWVLHNHRMARKYPLVNIRECRYWNKLGLRFRLTWLNSLSRVHVNLKKEVNLEYTIVNICSRLVVACDRFLILISQNHLNVACTCSFIRKDAECISCQETEFVSKTRSLGYWKICVGVSWLFIGCVISPIGMLDKKCSLSTS